MAIARRIVPLGVDGLDLLPAGCRSCVRWELDPVAAAVARRRGSSVQAKRDWWRDALAEGVAGGVLARVEGEPVGYATWALPQRAQGGRASPTAPAGTDAVLLLALRVEPGRRGAGLGRWLLQAVVRQSMRQQGNGNGMRAVEAYGDRRQCAAAPEESATSCLVPEGFYLACGFEVTREHPTTPRLRMDARRLASWREDVRADVEEAWVRLRGVVSPDPGPHPVRSARCLFRP